MQVEQPEILAGAITSVKVGGTIGPKNALAQPALAQRVKEQVAAAPVVGPMFAPDMTELLALLTGEL